MAANGSSDDPTGPFNNNSGPYLHEDTSKQDAMDTSTEEVQGAAGGNVGPRSSVKPGASAVSTQNSVPGIVNTGKPGVAGTKDMSATASTTGRSGSEGSPGNSSKTGVTSSGGSQKTSAADKIVFSSGTIRSLDPRYDPVTGIKLPDSWADEVDKSHPLQETCKPASNPGDFNQLQKRDTGVISKVSSVLTYFYPVTSDSLVRTL